MLEKTISKLQRKPKYISALFPIIINISNWYDIILLYFKVRKSSVLRLKNGVRFKITHYLDALAVKEIFIDDEYSSYLDLDNPKIIIIIGANIGTFSILQSIKHPTSKIYSYEPASNTYLLFEANLKLNKVKNVIPIKKAIAGERGDKNLYVYEASGLSSLFNKRSNAKIEKVETITLINIFRENKINHCELLKIDCEGAEYDILFKTPKELFTKINNIVLEYHDSLAKYNHINLLRFLKSNGYTVQLKKHYAENDIGIIYAKRETVPLISIVIPVFKRFGFAKQAIKSVLNQKNINLEDVELIICDDKKGRSNRDFYKKIYPKTIYLKNKFDEGPGGNRQTGLKNARGKYIVFLDSDDRLKPYFLAKMIRTFKYDASDIGVVCLSEVKFERGFNIFKKVKLLPLMLLRDIGILSGFLFNRGYLYKTSFYLCQISHMMFRKSAIENLKFNYDYRRGGEDWDFILKALEDGEVKILPMRLLTFRYSYGSSTDTQINRKLKWDSYLLLLSKLPTKLRRGIFYNLFRLYIGLFKT